MTRPLSLSRPNPVTDASPPTSRVLNPRDDAIVGLLRDGVSMRRILDIGAYRKAWTRADVDRLIALYTGRTVRTDPNRIPWRPSGVQGPRPFTAAPPREVDLSVRQIEVLDGLCRDHDWGRIAFDLGIAERSVRGYANDVVRAMGADDVEDAVWMARTGEVRLYIVDRRRDGRPSRGDGREAAA